MGEYLAYLKLAQATRRGMGAPETGIFNVWGSASHLLSQMACFHSDSKAVKVPSSGDTRTELASGLWLLASLHCTTGSSEQILEVL